MIVVTAPTSNIGRQVLANILDSGEPIRVIARDPSRLPAHPRESVEVVQGSHSDLDVVSQAFTGADAVFWLVPPSTVAQSLEAAYLDFTRSACEAIKSHGVRRVVGISALGRGTPLARNAGLVTASLAMDDLIASTGVSYRALTMPSFMDNVLRQVEPIKSRGVFFSPLTETANSPPALRATLPLLPPDCFSRLRGAALATRRSLAPRICHSTTWRPSSPTCWENPCASSRSPSRRSRLASSNAAPPRRSRRA